MGRDHQASTCVTSRDSTNGAHDVRITGARDGTGALKLPPKYTAGSVSPLLDASLPGQTYPPLAPKDPPRLANEWEFSGWGDVSHVELSAEEVEAARVESEEEKKRDGHETLGSW